MKSTIKKTVTVILLFILAIQFFGYSNVVKKQSSIITQLRSSLKEADAKYDVQERELNDYKVRWEEQQSYMKEKGNEGLELIERLPKIESLAELIGAYQSRMDGAVSEGYGHRLATLTRKEGLIKLIQVLSEKDESVIEDTTFLLFGEYSIAGQNEEVELAIKELEAMDLDSMDAKHRGIVLNLLAEAYFTKSRIKGI